MPQSMIAAGAVLICSAAVASGYAVVRAEPRGEDAGRAAGMEADSRIRLTPWIDPDLRAQGTEAVPEVPLIDISSLAVVGSLENYFEQHFGLKGTSFDMRVGGVVLRNGARTLRDYGVMDRDVVSVLLPMDVREGNVASDLARSTSEVERFSSIDNVAQVCLRDHPAWELDSGDAFLGKGEFGRVFRGVRSDDGLPVAIKVQKSGRDFDSASEIAAQTVASDLGLAPRGYAYWRCHARGGDLWYDLFVMELVSGDTLSTYLNEHTEKESESDVLCKGNHIKTADEAYVTKGMYEQMRTSLRSLAGRGVLHGDVHQENVMVDGQGRLKYIDFGMLRYAGRDDVDRSAIDGYIDSVVGELWGCDPDTRPGPGG